MARPTPRGAPDTALSRRDLMRLQPARREPSGGHYVRIHRLAMACRFEVTFSGEHAAWVPAALQALGEAERVEAALTVFRPSSEVVRLNAEAADREVKASEDLFALLMRCRALHADTGGAFDVTTMPLSRAWGFLERRPARPTGEALAEARRAVGMDRVALDAERRGVRFLSRGMALNFGSIGKGVAVQAVADALAALDAGDALVSAGGSSVAAVGPRRWPVDVVARAAGRTIARLRLKGAALATSGAGEQFLDVDGVRRGHVIDPRTGWPAAGVLSASVVTDDAADADALATACFVGGEAVARACAAARPRTLVILAPATGDGRTLVLGSHPSVNVEAL
jgi:thiamine biosynthesis lipoprotein